MLLLDEPLSNLDARLRLEMRTELQRAAAARLGITMIFVTHDQAEALALADRIVVMLDGAHRADRHARRISTIAPRSPFVADFVGFENIFAVEEGRLATTGGSLAPGFALPAAAGAGLAAAGGGAGRRPVSRPGARRLLLGQTVEYLLDTPLGPIKAEVPAAAPRHERGDGARLRPAGGDGGGARAGMMRRVWIDTDMGFDDIAAIARGGACPDVAIDGVSLVFGNAPMEQVRRNAARAAGFFGWAMPIHAGRGLPCSATSKPRPMPSATAACRPPAGRCPRRTAAVREPTLPALWSG